MASTSTTVPAPPSSASRWYFSPDQLTNTPSVKAGYHLEKELSYRQQAANFIQDMGQRLKVTQLCINTAIVYMQRFYMFHSFSRFHRNTIATASLFLAAKVEEQPRKLEHVIKVAHICLHRDQPHLDPRSELYQEQAQELVTNENILLQTLGFDVAIDHPHTHVVKCCQLVRASKELAQTSYFMASNSLHLTTMCLRYSPTIVACVCIHLACKWSKYKIPLSAQNKEWFKYVDSTVTLELLETLTEEFLTIFEQCPSRLKRKIMASTQATGEEEERRAHNDVAATSYQPDLSVHSDPSTSSKHPTVPGTSRPSTSSGGHQRSAAGQVKGRPSLPNMPGHHAHHHAHHHHHKHEHQKHQSRHSMEVAAVPRPPEAFDALRKQQQQGQKPPNAREVKPSPAKPAQHQVPQKTSSHVVQQPHQKHGHGVPPQGQHQQPRPSSASSQSVKPSSSLSNWASSMNQKPQAHHQQQRPGHHDKKPIQRPKPAPTSSASGQQQRRSIFDIDNDPPAPQSVVNVSKPPSYPQQEMEPGEIVDEPKTGPSATQTPLSRRLGISSTTPGAAAPSASSSKSPVKQPKLKLPAQTQHRQKSLFSPPSEHHGHYEHRKRTVSNSSSSNGEVSVGLHKMEDTSGLESLKPGAPGGKPSSKLNPQVGQDHKPMLVSIPLEEINSGGHSHKSKKHKKEKKKKDKKEKRDRPSDSPSSEKRHKSKHKDKDRDREKTRHGHSHSSKSSDSPPGSEAIPKLKIKLGSQTVTAESPDDGSLPKLKISLGDKSAKKRPRENGSHDPDHSALKMSRALGSSYETETMFLAENSTKLKKVKLNHYN